MRPPRGEGNRYLASEGEPKPQEKREPGRGVWATLQTKPSPLEAAAGARVNRSGSPPTGPRFWLAPSPEPVIQRVVGKAPEGSFKPNHEWARWFAAMTAEEVVSEAAKLGLAGGVLDRMNTLLERHGEALIVLPKAPASTEPMESTGEVLLKEKDPVLKLTDIGDMWIYHSTRWKPAEAERFLNGEIVFDRPLYAKVGGTSEHNTESLYNVVLKTGGLKLLDLRTPAAVVPLYEFMVKKKAGRVLTDILLAKASAEPPEADEDWVFKNKNWKSPSGGEDNQLAAWLESQGFNGWLMGLDYLEVMVVTGCVMGLERLGLANAAGKTKAWRGAKEAPGETSTGRQTRSRTRSKPGVETAATSASKDEKPQEDEKPKKRSKNK